MPSPPSPFAELARRLETVEDRARPLLVAGLPFPSAALRNGFEEEVRAGALGEASAVVERAETLLARAEQDWGWLSGLLRRVDELRAVAEAVGIDLLRLEARIGDPRAQLLAEPLTVESLERAGTNATFALSVLEGAVPRFVLEEARALGTSIRRARDRGEDVHDAVESFAGIVQGLQEPNLFASAEHLVATRKLVARIPREPPVATIPPEEEEEILVEARNLARRLQQIKSQAHDASGAVRLMTQVRQVLSEERRFAAPEGEVEELWDEVDRLAEDRPAPSSEDAVEGSVEISPTWDGAFEEGDGAETGGPGPGGPPADEPFGDEREVEPDGSADVDGEPIRVEPSRSAPGNGRADRPPSASTSFVRPERLAFTSAYVPPGLASTLPAASGGRGSSAGALPRRPRSRHRQ